MAQSVSLRDVLLKLCMVILCKNQNQNENDFIANALSPTLDSGYCPETHQVLKHISVLLNLHFFLDHVAMCLIGKLTSILMVRTIWYRQQQS